MSAQILFFSAGLLLLLVGIIGGGFEVKGAKIPKVGNAQRGIASVAGIALIAVGYFAPPSPETGPDGAAEASVAPVFESAAQSYGSQLGSVRTSGQGSGKAELVQIVVQPFTRGSMIWRLDQEDSVYVLDGHSNWQIYSDVDSPDEDMQHVLDSLTDDRKSNFLATGAFLRQWHKHDLESELGWPEHKEYPVEHGVVQHFENGTLMGLFPFWDKSAREFTGEPNTVMVLLMAADGEGGQWHRMGVSP